MARESGGPEAALWPNLGVHICLVYIMGVYLYRYMDTGVHGHIHIYTHIYAFIYLYIGAYRYIHMSRIYGSIWIYICIYISVYLGISTISKFDVNGFS